jgi:hypothetical protein
MKADTSKSTILVIAMGFLVMHLVFAWKWAIMTSLVTGMIGIFSPSLTKIIDVWWMKLAHLLGSIIPNILLSLVFFGVLFPLALAARLFNKDPLMLSSRYDSYFIDTNRQIGKKDLEKMW